MTTKSDGTAAVIEKIKGLGDFEDTGRRIHEVIMAAAPELEPRLWYGMPGYAKAKRSPVICFVRVDDGQVTFGITEKADLTPEDGAPDQLIGSAWFVTGLDERTERSIAAIVERAAR